MTDKPSLTELLDRRRISYRVEEIEHRKITGTMTTVSTKQKVVVILGMLAALVLWAIFLLYAIPKELEG
jgi:hypothetical protein